jgi:glycosyltransferase involved in cell wall biosynthesis
MELTAVILTHNEELHIARCIHSIKTICKKVIVVDSFSGDNTIAIAGKLGADIYQNEWNGSYSAQFNWALENCKIDSDWVLRIDADEYFTPELVTEILTINEVENHVTGFVIKRRHIFMDRWVKHGVYPVRLLRIFKREIGYCEKKWMDEHIVLTKGRPDELKSDFVDHSLKPMDWWLKKHLHYAFREACDLINIELNYELLGNQNDEKNLTPKMKRVYEKSPVILRVILLYIYRYFIRGGFRDGIAGFYWHLFQGLFYRLLVDYYIIQIRLECGDDLNLIRSWFKTKANIDLENIHLNNG